MTIELYRWTQTAVDCYERGCICHGCIMANTLETKCKMKKSVIALVRKLGKPPLEIYTSAYNKIYQ